MSRKPMPLPTSANDKGGFLTAMGGHGVPAWPMAVMTIAALTGSPDDEVRDFLDSPYGVALAEDILVELNDTRSSLRSAVLSVAVLWTARYERGRVTPYLESLVRRVSACRRCGKSPGEQAICVVTGDVCDPATTPWRASAKGGAAL